MQPKTEDKTLPMIRIDHQPAIVDEIQHHDFPENRSWVRGSPIQFLGAILMVILLWFSVSGRVCGGLRRLRQSPHNSMEQGILKDTSNIEVGDVRPPYREYRRHETSASITGHFVLYDLLELTSQSGDIDITFTPQPRKTRAVLHIGTRSGSIRVRLAPEFLSAVSEPLTTLPRDQSHSSDRKSHHLVDFSPVELQKIISRPFLNEIHTETGSITAKILAGNGDRSHIGSSTGSLTLDIMVVGASGNNSTSLLDTLTSTGSQTIRVMPLNLSKDPMITKLAAQHISQASGNMDFFYSDEWRGRVKVAIAGSGNIDVEGTDLGIDVKEPGRVEAHRGNGELVNIVSQGSGSVTFTN